MPMATTMRKVDPQALDFSMCQGIGLVFDDVVADIVLVEDLHTETFKWKLIILNDTKSNKGHHANGNHHARE